VAQESDLLLEEKERRMVFYRIETLSRLSDKNYRNAMDPYGSATMQIRDFI